MTTTRQLEWLTLLSLKPGSVRQKSRVAYDCMQKGWTQWNYRARDGAMLTQEEAQERFGERYWEHVRVHGERLTEAGKAALAAGR